MDAKEKKFEINLLINTVDTLINPADMSKAEAVDFIEDLIAELEMKQDAIQREINSEDK